MDDNELAKNISVNFPEKGNDIVTYSFPVKILDAREDGDAFILKLSPTMYGKSGKDFEYRINKESFNGSIEDIPLNSPVILKLNYDLTHNLQYFVEYSICTAKKTYSIITNTASECGSGNCLVKRDVKSWSIQSLSVSSEDSYNYLNGYDKDLLNKELIYFFMTDDFGYFDPQSVKYYMVQSSGFDKTFRFSSEVISNAQEGKNLASMLFWSLSGFTNLYGTDLGIDFNKYLDTVNSYVDQETMGDSYLLNCRASSYIVSNLKECFSPECNNIKEISIKYCKDSLDKAMNNYEKDASSFSEGNSLYSYQGYVFGISGEMVRYNEMNNDISSKYGQTDLLKYYESGKRLLSKNTSILAKCYVLDSAKKINNIYPNSTLTADMKNISASIPELSSFCNGNEQDPYCTADVSEKLVCADAMMAYNNEEAIDIMSSIFSAQYSKSPNAVNMKTYEQWRTSPFSKKNENSMKKFNEYGYFTNTRTNSNSLVYDTDVRDSYYFINLFNLLTRNE